MTKMELSQSIGRGYMKWYHHTVVIPFKEKLQSLDCNNKTAYMIDGVDTNEAHSILNLGHKYWMKYN